MKNIIKVALLLLMVTGAVSCNLDKYPVDSLPADKGFVTFSDAQEFRLGFYNFARSCFPPDAGIGTGIQAEGINPTMDYGNFYGAQYKWQFNSSDSLIEGLWQTSYAAIFQINFFLEKVELLDRDAMTAVEKELLDLYIGEAYFFRAMINNQLATFYCKDYDPATAEDVLGIIISTKANIDAREKRSSLYGTYVAINEDIAKAETAINEYYKETAAEEYFIDKWTVKALKAKVALQTHEYKECAELCVELLNKFQLISSDTAFANLWKNDKGTEVIFQFFASVNEGAYAFGSIFLNDPYNDGTKLKPFYIPDQWIMDQYNDNDIRKSVYFGMKNMRIGNSDFTLYAVTKYPGNPAYNTSTRINEAKQNIRPYRSGDFCLMAAEAYAMAGEIELANTYLKKLLTARIPGFVYTDYTISEIMPVIKLERLKELYMEGNRIADLKRWGDPMTRVGHFPQNQNAIISTNAELNLVIPANDPMFLWPIPQSEVNGNPNIQPNA